MLGYRYDNSPICIPDGTPPPPDPISDYYPTARPGARAPHAWLADGRSTLDLFGRGFVLLDFPGAPADATRLTAAARAQRVPLAVVPIADPAIAALYGTGWSWCARTATLPGAASAHRPPPNG